MQAAGGDRYDVGKSGHGHRLQAVGVGPVAELAVTVETPSSHGAIGEQRQVVVAAGGDRGYSNEPGDGGWLWAIGCVAISDLTESIHAPGPHRTIDT